MTTPGGPTVVPVRTPGPTDVLRRLPHHQAPSVRRTSSLLLAPDPSWTDGLQLTGLARDLVVHADGSTEVVNSIEVNIGIDRQSRVHSVDGAATGIAREIIGLSVVAGFRAGLQELYGRGLDEESLLAGVLDDVPTVRLIAGYASLMEALDRDDIPKGSPKIDICAGWAEDATAHRRSVGNQPLVMSAPPAPAISEMVADDIDFHAEPATVPRTMRRRRILEVVPSGDQVRLLQYFRDSHISRSGHEGSLHEYLMTAAADADDLSTVRDIDVQARALPFPECPLAAQFTGDLVGMPLAEASRGVRNRLVGTHSCTHLNDTLRYLRFVPALRRLAS